MRQERPPPARPWYTLVSREIALRGWTKTELSERSGVARTTIDNWSTNRRKPSAKAVNAVADVLQIDRAQAHVLAGIVTPEAPPELSKALVDEIAKLAPAPEDQERIYEFIRLVRSGRLPRREAEPPDERRSRSAARAG